MLYLVIAIIIAFDLLVIKWKFEHQRYADAILDIILFYITNQIFGGSLGGELIASMGAFIISVYLLAYPPNLGAAE